MDKNYKVTIQYDGSRYKGWQNLKSTDATIQGKIAAVLKQLDGQAVLVNGSGRTDAGVHALGQTANFHLTKDFRQEEIMEYMNQYLPEDIGITAIEEVPKRFHARLHAQSKTYVYRIWNSTLPNVFDRKWMYTIASPLDVAAMQIAAKKLIGTHDFAAFCSVKQKKKSTVRIIYDICVEKIGHEVRICVTGNGFLHHMVRILAGTLTETGLLTRSPAEMTDILASQNRERAGITLPAKGLVLQRVSYPKEIE